MDAPHGVKSLQRRCIRTGRRNKSPVGLNAVIRITRKCRCHTKRFIKRFLYKPGSFKKELLQCLRSGRVVRKTRTASLKGKGLGSIPDAILISVRPSDVADRAIPGHWEGDLIEGSQNSYIVTMLERHSCFFMLAKISDNKTAPDISALIKQARQLPVELYKTLNRHLFNRHLRVI